MRFLLFAFFFYGVLLANPLQRPCPTDSLSVYQNYADRTISQWNHAIQSEPFFVDVNALNAHPNANGLVSADVEDFDQFKRSQEYEFFRDRANQLILEGGLVKEFFFSFAPLDGRSIDITDERAKLSYLHEIIIPGGNFSVLPIYLEIREILQYRLQLEKLAEECGEDPVQCIKNAKLIFHVNEINWLSFQSDLEAFHWFEFSPENIVILVQPTHGVYREEKGRFLLDPSIQRRTGHGYAFMQVVHPGLGEGYTFSPIGELRRLTGSAVSYFREKGAEWMLSTPVTDLTQLTSSALDRDRFAIVLSLAAKGHNVVVEMVENPLKRTGAYWVRNGSNPPFVAHTIELLHATPGLQRPLERLVDEKAMYNRFSHYVHLETMEKVFKERTLPLYIRADEMTSTYRLESYSDDLLRMPEIKAAAFHQEGVEIHTYKSDEDFPRLLAFLASQDADPVFKRKAKEVFLKRARKRLNEPLQFRTNWVKCLWGGTRIAELKNIPTELHEKIGETWEISSQPRNPSQLVIDGQLQPLTLEDLMNDEVAAEKIVGSRVFSVAKNWFPILYKFLDANKILSVQVHPSTQVSEELGEGEPGKSETWVVLDAKPDAFVYVGLKEGVSCEDLEKAIENGEDLLALMKKHPVKAGDVLKNDAGVIHAIGAGVFVAEIQGNSDVTYRLHDHNRQPHRPLHVPQALKAVDVRLSQIHEARPRVRVEQYSTHGSKIELLVKDPYYEVRRAHIKYHDHVIVNSGDDCQIVSVIRGRAYLCAGRSKTLLHQGQTVLVPASVNPIRLMTKDNEAQILLIKPGEKPRSVPKPKPIQFVEATQLTEPIHLAMSVGGTKLFLGAMSSSGFIEVSHRVEWKEVLESRRRYSAEGFVELLVDEIQKIVFSLEKKGISREKIQKLGLAWPGPGDYKNGVVSATFLPGFDPYPLKSVLAQRLQKQLQLRLEIELVLDAWADALGEMAQDETLKNWMYLNVATGIAVGIVKEGKILDAYEWPDGRKVEWGLGQIGRHLIRKVDGTWEYRPTLHAEIPRMEEGEVRLTEWLGGPALARRLIEQIMEKSETTEVVPSYFLGTPVQLLKKAVEERNAEAVQKVLSMVQLRAREKNELAIEMINEFGAELGKAIRTFADAFPQEFFYNRIIVGGGVLENLGKDIFVEKSNLDALLVSMIRASQISNIRRTRLDVRRELLAFKPPNTHREAELLVFDMDDTLYHAPELARLHKEAVYELYRFFHGGSMQQAREVVEAKRQELSKNQQPSGDRNVVEALGFTYKDMILMKDRYIGDQSRYIEPVSGLLERLLELKKQYRLVLATNNVKGPTLAILKKLGVADLFEKIYTQDETDFHKPDPKLFQLIRTDTGISYERMVSIGDREEADIAPARLLGMQTLLVKGPEDLVEKIDQIFLKENNL